MVCKKIVLFLLELYSIILYYMLFSTYQTLFTFSRKSLVVGWIILSIILIS